MGYSLKVNSSKLFLSIFSPAVKKHAAARELFDKLPADSIDVIYKMWHAKVGIK